jgi:hypothetical protein
MGTKEEVKQTSSQLEQEELSEKLRILESNLRVNKIKQVSFDEAFDKCNQTLNTVVDHELSSKFKELIDNQIDMCVKDMMVMGGRLVLFHNLIIMFFHQSLSLFYE